MSKKSVFERDTTGWAYQTLALQLVTVPDDGAVQTISSAVPSFGL